MSDRIMTHLIAGYPSSDIAVACAEGLVRGGATYLEVQFPFSDPSADGPIIQHACQTALEGGFTVESGFRQIEQIRSVVRVPIFIMSYASIPFAAGIRNFLEQVKSSGADGVIIPDLMPGYDEGLYELSSEIGIEAIPVVAPGISDRRLEHVGQTKSKFLYTALRTGITGSVTELGDDTVRYLDRLAKLGKMVLAGFGVTSRIQVKEVTKLVHAAVVGSELVRTLNGLLHGGRDTIVGEIQTGMERKIRELVED